MKPVVVVDAGVSLKWFVPTRPEYHDVPAALELLQAYAEDRLELFQPPLWRAEVLAALTRLMPGSVLGHAERLLRFDHEAADAPAIYLKAIALSTALGHPLFDTMYHAAALLHPNAVLVTANLPYLAKAEHLGKALPLPLWKKLFD